jgi:choline dehydrogenase-like flavoprotein
MLRLGAGDRAAREVTEALGVSNTRSEMVADESSEQALKGDKHETSLWEDGAVRSTYLATMKDGQRLTMQELLFKLLVKHRNLRVVMNARVQEVLFQDTVAVGVRYRDTQTGTVHEVHTARGGEVVLCAGALSTPCLLLQSRLGMQRMLRRLHNKRVTPVVKSFPDVGKRIFDHTVTPMVLFGLWKPKQRNPATANTAAEPTNSIHGYIYLTTDGRLCTNPDDIPR